MESICSADQSSEFSIISFSSTGVAKNMQEIKTRANIYISDDIMQKIIQYISTFSEEFRS
jgi:hypothetical protein